MEVWMKSHEQRLKRSVTVLYSGFVSGDATKKGLEEGIKIVLIKFADDFAKENKCMCRKIK